VGTAQEFTRMVDAITKEDLVEALKVCLGFPGDLILADLKNRGNHTLP